MKIRAKLLLFNLVIVVPFLVNSAYTVITGNQNRELITKAVTTSLPNVVSTERFWLDVLQIQQYLKDAAARRDGPVVSRDLLMAESIYQDARASLVNVTGLDSGSNVLTITSDELETFYQSGVSMAKAFGWGDSAAAEVFMSKFDANAEYIINQLGALKNGLTADLENDLSILKTAMESASILSSIMLASAIALVVLLSLVFSNSLATPLGRLGRITSAMARGDLSQSVAAMKRKDELGVLARNFNTAIGQLRDIVEHIKSSSAENGAISRELTGNLEQTSAAVTQISANIDSIIRQFAVLVENITSSSSAVEEIFANINGLAGQIENQASAVAQTSASIEEMTASIESVARIARDKQTATTGLKDLTREGGKRVDMTFEIVSAFSKSADDMLDMIQVINDVANRTNLLSMNAAIEAAHAGDFGRGFAVVADEIRKLAESTGANAKSISKSLKSIIEKVGKALEASKGSGDAFHGISAEVEEVVDAFTEISNSTNELSVGGKEILASVTSLTGITEEIKNGSTEIKAGALDVNTALQRIKDISNESLAGMREIGAGAGEINAAVVQISELSVKNNENVSRLSGDIARFMTGGGEGEGGASGLTGESAERK
jgi:methyl-accepting chemotaxis protein